MDWSLLLDAEPSARAKAEALQRALQGKAGLGQLFQLSGDKVIAPVGQGLVGQAGQQMQQLGQIAQQRQAADLQRQGLSRQDAAQAESARHNRAVEALTKATQEQEAWAFGQDATGGGFMFNKKTGIVVPLQANGAFPGAGSGLKPAQFEADVQQLGKDVEPVAKAAPDIQKLKTAAAKEDTPGFGPLAGRVPNMLMSGEGVEARQAAGRLMAALINLTSGTAASEAEVERLLEARGLGRTATPDQFRQGVTALEAEYRNLLKQRQAKYHPTVVETYGARGGYSGEPAPASPPAQARRRKYNPQTGTLE